LPIANIADVFIAHPMYIGLRRGHAGKTRLILKVDIGERLAVGVTHRECGGAFLNGQRRREAAGRHFKTQ
jgi:hypothetical protein